MPPLSTPIALPKPQARSRVGNGKTLFLDQVDGRSVIAGRFREIFAQICEDIGGDPSEAQRQLARRASALAIWCECAEAQLVAGTEINIAAFTTATNSMRRLLADLGLERHTHDMWSW